jgi:F0F1-type ATP synthase membrane subunit b/b'
MANPNDQTQAGSSAAAQLEADVKRAVEQGLDLQDQVRQLTLAQFSSGKFDLAALRELSQAVLNGALAGAQPLLQPALAQTGQAKEQLQQVVAGLDAALAQLAQGASLALQEAAGKAQAFSATDLKHARADFEQLEQMFLETLRSTASRTRDAAGVILSELLAHSRLHGSAVGAQLQQGWLTTAQQLGEVGKAQLDAGLKLAQASTDLLRQIAAGVLGGLAEQVKPAARADAGAQGGKGGAGNAGGKDA